MALFNINEKTQEELNSLNEQEDDVDKIAKLTHRSLLMLSVKDVVMEMKQKEKEKKRKKNENEEEKEENDIELFHELIKNLI